MMVESTYISDLIEEVRIKIKKKNVKGEIKFKELSEGEQQLLTVIGLLKFTKDEESLILLDEPDTHLNPIWKWRYLRYLKDVITDEDSTQIIINTHDPLVIGGLVKEQVRMFVDNKGTITTSPPDINPKGLGVAGILTSELFGLPTILDEGTQNDLEEKRRLQILFKEGALDANGRQKLIELEDKLEKFGFPRYERDPVYQRFIEIYLKRKELQALPKTAEEREAQDIIMLRILDDILKEEK